MRRAVIILGLALAAAFGGSLALEAQAEKAPETVILKGSPLGGVKFDHPGHAKLDEKCESCHHPSKPEKSLATPYQKCQDCHTTPATPPMKTRAQFAFHDGPAKKGLCVGCHQKAAGKAPLKCNECHKKEHA